MKEQFSDVIKRKVVDTVLNAEFNKVSAQKDEFGAFKICLAGETFGIIGALAAIVDTLCEESDIPQDVILDYVGIIVDCLREQKEDDVEFMYKLANKLLKKEGN